MRIAYAGAPLSGKTATMKALMSILRSQTTGDLVYSPLEARGRTIYFDWAEYQGGSFRDGQVKCQITSVPGQESLRRRRNLLIEAADAVVFVIDSRSDQMEVNRKSLAELRPWLDRYDLAPIDVVYQCNKRDLPGTLGMDQIREELALGSEAELYESSALQGDGVRIAFVAAVRFGVRQAEILRASNRLPTGTPEIATGEQLLDQVRLADDPSASPTEPEPAPAPVPVPPPVPPPTSPAPLSASPAAQASAQTTSPASPQSRPAVMPMADWLAERAAQVGHGARPATAMTPESLKTVATPETPEPPEIPEAAKNADAEILEAMASESTVEPVDVEAMKIVATAPTSAVPKPPEPQGPTARPAPWLRGGEAGVLAAWPAGIWEAIRLSVDPSLDPPKANLEVLQGRIGGGWHARSGGLCKSLEEGRAQSQRLVDWLTRLGDAVSVQRCIVLSVVAEGWRVWQLGRELPTLGMLLQQGLEPGLPSRKAVQILSQISSDFVSTYRDFADRKVELPLLLRTLAKEHGKTVYSGFLPNSPVPLREADPLAQLESELLLLAKAHRLGALDIPETLTELELLSARSPAVLPIVELLQSLLIGE